MMKTVSCAWPNLDATSLGSPPVLIWSGHGAPIDRIDVDGTDDHVSSHEFGGFPVSFATGNTGFTVFMPRVGLVYGLEERMLCFLRHARQVIRIRHVSSRDPCRDLKLLSDGKRTIVTGFRIQPPRRLPTETYGQTERGALLWVPPPLS